MTAGAIRAGKAFIEISLNDEELKKGLKAAKAKFMGFANSAKQFGTEMLGIGAAISAPLLLATRQFAQFEEQMKIVQAVTRSTGQEFDVLTNKAKELGLTTTFTATEAATAMEELGRAGFRAAEIVQALPSVLDLSRSTATELSEAARIAASTIRVFGLNAGQAARVANTLTGASISSAQTVEGLGEAFKFVGPFAKQAGLTLEETAGILGVLANNGIRGTVAGTGLARILKNLSQTPKIEALDKLGVDVSDSIGNMRDVRDILNDLFKTLAKSGTTERLNVFEQLFGRGAAAAITIAQTGDAAKNLTQDIIDMGDVANRTARTIEDSLSGSFKLAVSAVEGLAIAIGDALAPTLRKILDAFATVVRGVEFLTRAFWFLVPAAAAVGAAFVTLGGLALVAGVVSSFLASVATALPLVTALGVKLGIVSLQGTAAAPAIAATTTQLWAMNASLKVLAVSFGAISFTLATLAATVYAWSITQDIVAAREATQLLKEETQGALLAMEDLSRASGTGRFLTIEKAAEDAREYAMSLGLARKNTKEIVRDLEKNAKLLEKQARAQTQRANAGEDLLVGEADFLRGEAQERRRRAKAMLDLAKAIASGDEKFMMKFREELDKLKKAEGQATESAVSEAEKRKKAREEELRILKKVTQEREAAVKASRGIGEQRQTDMAAQRREEFISGMQESDPQELVNRLEDELAMRRAVAETALQFIERRLALTTDEGAAEALNKELKKKVDDEKRVALELKRANEALVASKRKGTEILKSVEMQLQNQLNEVASQEYLDKFEADLKQDPQRVLQQQQSRVESLSALFNDLGRRATDAAKVAEQSGDPQDIKRAEKLKTELADVGENLSEARSFRDRAKDAIKSLDSTVGTFSLAQSRAFAARSADKIQKAQLEVQQKLLKGQDKQTKEIQKINTGALE